jgi:DnaJ-class molecular chaperone
MATEDRSRREQAERDPLTCRPCRGTGQVVSNLGGTPSTVTCPWCDGTGHWLPDHDAQARARAERAVSAGG